MLFRESPKSTMVNLEELERYTAQMVELGKKMYILQICIYWKNGKKEAIVK